ncbi:GGDEF domain-containing protein [Hydrogenimonas sp.]|uniref:GGDEF domain-containing protein n=1 Tax=Hydrogenimonas sp. TaxID=2231112 RepID=UPI0026238BA8|nr:GGDEF domain-containing protein [Hydrogenimonas sp.]
MRVEAIDFYYRDELDQAYTRLAYILIIAMMLLYLNIYIYGGRPMLKLDAYYLFFAVASLQHLLFIKKYPEKGVNVRKMVVLFLDITVVTALIFFLEKYGFLFSILYLWIILGYGIRFGIRYLYLSGGISLAAILLLYLASPYWHAHVDLVLYMALTVLILPLFTIKLLHRIEEKNRMMLQLLEKVEQQSRFDSLTDIPNRFFFETKLKRCIEKGKPFSLFFIDLDGFKQINDTLGHGVGDRVLKQVAARLKRLTGKDDFIARLGGDEFVVITYRKGGEALKLAGEIVKALKEPYGANREIDTISASIGISDFPEDAKEEFTLKKYADMAMYEVKKRGKNSFLRHSYIKRGRS